MAVHDKNSIEGRIDDEVYASTDLSISIPKFKFSVQEQNPRNAYTIVHDEFMVDGNARQNLATFCKT